MVRIYISSTYEDLIEYRKVVYEALKKYNPSITVIAMENYVARDQRPLDACLKDVASCDIYIGIFAWRYGFIPEDKKENPDKLSITELEYRKAKEIGIPCLIFLLDDKMSWPLSFIDGTEQSETNKDNINRLRKYFKNSYITSFFKNPDNLASQVVPAVNNKLQELNSDTGVQIITGNKTSVLSSLLFQKPSSTLFKGEKSFFVGREEYINKIIKEQIQIPALKVCIVGPGGSGKSQLAFKAIHNYEKEGLFDLVVAVYFSDVSYMSFSAFLWSVAKSFIDVNQIGEFEKLDMEGRKTVIYNFLDQKKNPLIFLDNYETVSNIINDERQTATEQYNEAVNISNYLNNKLPSKTSVLVTSRERNNNFEDKEISIDLEGLQEQETMELFSKLTKERYLRNIENIMKDSTSKSALTKIFKMTGGHPLSIEIIAKNISNIHQINQMADTLGLGIVNPNEPEKRLRSLEACFDYTISRLSEEIKNLLYNLTVFKSPFPFNVAEKIFNKDVNFIVELQDRSLLFEIKSETGFGQITYPEYWLYSIHPAIRNYLEKTMQKAIGKTIGNLEKEHAYNFYTYYKNMLWNTYNSIGKDIHRSSIARFNLIFNQGSENNDFDNAITFAEYHDELMYCASMSRSIGIILLSMGLFSKALEYNKKALGFDQELNDKAGMADDCMGIGIAYNETGNYEQALKYHNKALEIHIELNNKVELTKDHYSISFPLYRMNKKDEALDHLSIAKTILLDFQKETGYSHPLLKGVEDRLTELKQDKE